MDPREVGPQVRKAHLSPLMESKNKASQGEKVNFCPFGCEDSQLDEHGYCQHLIGFTEDGQTYEPQHKDGERYKVFGGQRQKVQKGDKLVRITTCSRVYRDIKDGQQKVGTP